MPAFRLLDVGFGHGDMLRADRALGEAPDIAVDLIGVDLNPKSAAIARAATPIHWPIEYRTGDYRDVAGPIDFIVSSAVTHHMSDAEIHDFLALHGGARGARLDGQRHPSRRLRLSRLSLALPGDALAPDGARGRAAVDRARLPRAPTGGALIDEAGLPDPAAPRIVRRFPFRLCVERLR